MYTYSMYFMTTDLLTIKHRNGGLHWGRCTDQLEFIDITHKEMLTHIAKAVNVGRRAKEQLNQPYKVAGNIGREGGQALQ